MSLTKKTLLNPDKPSKPFILSTNLTLIPVFRQKSKPYSLMKQTIPIIPTLFSLAKTTKAKPDNSSKCYFVH